jgi:Tol biopolymer transport system component
MYEMSTGKRAFEGSSQASLIAGILEREPVSVSSLNPMTPPALERLIRKCLNKNPEQRWQSARDLADDLRWISSNDSSQVGLPAAVSAKRKSRVRALYGALGLVTIVAALFAFLWVTREIPENRVARFKVKTDPHLSGVVWPRISPDGKNLAFLATDSTGRQMIWMRPLNSLEAYPLAGTEGAGRPFWSPDSKQLAFIEDRGQLKKIPATGGPVQLVCETRGGADGSWGTGNLIIFDGGTGDSIRVVSASGGTPVGATTLDREANETGHAWPWFLPDGRHFLYLSDNQDSIQNGATYMLKVGDVESDDVVDLFPVDARVEYSAQGYIVYFKDNILLARRFNPETFEVVGEGMPITDQIGVGDANRAEFGVSDNGTLAYQTNSTEVLNSLIWVDRSGKELGRIGTPDGYEDFNLSPDGQRVVVSINDGSQRDIWVRDIRRDVATRITFDDGDDITPVWSNDGKSIYFASNRSNRFEIYRKSANGLGTAILIGADDSLHIAPNNLTKDGRWLYGPAVQTNWQIMRLDLEDSARMEMVVATPYYERSPRLSPDDRFMAYFSNESGQPEVYLLELGEGGGRWQVSSGGGMHPFWSADGKELLYFSTDWDLMEMPVSFVGDQVEFGDPGLLFRRRLNTFGLGRSRYATTADKNKFLLNVPTARSGGGEFVIVLNWFKDIESR